MPKILIYNDQGDDQGESGYSLRAQRAGWWLESGDIFLTHTDLPAISLQCIADIKQFDANKVTCIKLPRNNKPLCDNLLENATALAKLKICMKKSNAWELMIYDYNQSVVSLGIELKLLLPDSVSLEILDGKYFFHVLAKANKISKPEMRVCNSISELAHSMETFLKKNDTLILKRSAGMGGVGNIGISKERQPCLPGTYKTLYLEKSSTKALASQVWDEPNFNRIGGEIICETYHPSVKTISAEILIPSSEEKPHILTSYEIKMNPLYSGLELPIQTLNSTEYQEFTHSSLLLAKAIQQLGYTGIMTCDAIKSIENKILFNEINLRPGSGTCIHYIGASLLGENYNSTHNMLLIYAAKCDYSFDELKERMVEKKLQFSKDVNEGILITAYVYQNIGQCDYLVIAQSSKKLNSLYQEMQDFLEPVT
jgi:hypothetical protein